MISIFIVREEIRLMMFQYRVITRVFGAKGEEITGGRRKLNTEELDDLLANNIKCRIYNAWEVRKMWER
jgi:hypothetical protein